MKVAQTDGTTKDEVVLTGSSAQVDATSTPSIPNAGYNGATWDKWRNNTQGTLLASALRNSTVLSPNMVNHNARGILLVLQVTAASGTGGLQVQFGHNDPVTGLAGNLNEPPPIITGIGTYFYELYPGASGGTGAGSYVQQRTSGSLPRSWYVAVVHGDASDYTYSVGYSLIL